MCDGGMYALNVYFAEKIITKKPEFEPPMAEFRFFLFCFFSNTKRKQTNKVNMCQENACIFSYSVL